MAGPLARSQRKVQATTGPYAPNLQGYTRTTKIGTMGLLPRKGTAIPKPNRSSDRGLQLALVKLERVVIAGQHPAVNMPLLLAHTARQTMRVGSE